MSSFKYILVEQKSLLESVEKIVINKNLSMLVESNVSPEFLCAITFDLIWKILKLPCRDTLLLEIFKFEHHDKPNL